MLPLRSHRASAASPLTRRCRVLKEFSFFGPEGTVELSSRADARGRRVDPAIWQEGADTKAVVIRNAQDHIGLYEPLFVDADLHRFHPDLPVGHYYGMIYVELSKEVHSVVRLMDLESILNIVDSLEDALQKVSL